MGKKKRGFKPKEEPEKFAYGSDEESGASLQGDDDSADEIEKHNQDRENRLIKNGKIFGGDDDSALSSDEEAIPLESSDDDDDEDLDNEDEDEDEDANYEDVDDDDLMAQNGDAGSDDEGDEDNEAIDDDDEMDNTLRHNPHIIRAKKDEMDSDIDERDSDDGLPNSKAWGKKKSAYFGTDYVDKDFRKRAGKEEDELAQAEEEEAKAIQMRLLGEINEDDLDLNRLPEIREGPEESVQQVEINIDSLSKKDKMELLKKVSPEMSSLVEDFKSSLAELERYEKLLNYSNIDDLVAYRTSLFYRVYQTKFNLVTRYCMNISFYLLLKSRGKSIGNHPCASNLVNLKKMILDIEKIENKRKFKELISEIFDKIESKGKVEMNEIHKEPNMEEANEMDLRDLDDNRTSNEPTPKKRVRFAADEEGNSNKQINKPTPEEDIELREYGDLREKNPDEEDDEEEEIDDEDADLEMDEETEEKQEDEDAVRRPINYQIAKNKGLTPKKSKEQRNPRVKHRMKYKKAKARRRGQVREPRKEIKKYAGEYSGIRSSTVKSIKFKY